MGSYATYPTRPLEMCPVCREVTQLCCGVSPGYQYTCSRMCSKRLEMRIRNGLASVMHYHAVYPASAPSVNTDRLRRRIKHLEAQVRAASQHKPKGTPIWFDQGVDLGE